MDDCFVELRVVHENLPDLIELEMRVHHGDWRARARAYASPDFIAVEAKRLIAWSARPEGVLRLEAGSDNGAGWLVLEFYVVDAARHARCALTLGRPSGSTPDGPAERWRFSIELRTELGLIERFGRECLLLNRDDSGIARLPCLPA